MKLSLLWQLACHVIRALKDAASGVRIHSTLFLSLVGKVAWAIPLFAVPHMFRVLPSVYRGFEEAGSEHAWAALILGLILGDVFAITHKGYWPQVCCLLLGAATWFFLGSMVSYHLPRGWLGLPGVPGAYLFGFAGIGCFVGVFKTSQRYHAEADADNWLMMAREMDRAQAAGEKWAQPAGGPQPAGRSQPAAPRTKEGRGHLATHL